MRGSARRWMVLVAGVVVGAAAISPGVHAAPAPSNPPPPIITGVRPTSTTPSGLPDGVPAAALRAEPKLPIPAGWPFPDAFPRTSGAGRLIGGAFEWSDFLYDDHGAKGVPVQFPVVSLAAPVGTYAYPAGPAAMNGADIFRTAVGMTSDASWWRVDWNTLVDPNVPIAEFAIDLDNNPATGTNVGLFHGIDVTIVMSAKGATVEALTTGAATSGAVPMTVDTASRSFVARIPRTTFDPKGVARIQLVAGLADASGHGFASPAPGDGALPGQPPYYNVAFRRYDQEPEKSNYWMESAQANALAAGDISSFANVIKWADLARRVVTPEPRPAGYTNRWFVTSLDLGQGVIADSGGGSDLRPNFLGRVQPYAIDVPTSYDGSKPVPLTFILHSLNEQHNQYGGLNPTFVQQACEARGSICVTALGRGPDGWYYDEAEVDFWEVWNRVAAAYRLDPERTAISGYSMGGWATYKLGLSHPDLFSKAVVLEGPVVCGIRVSTSLPNVGQGGRCSTDGDSRAVLASARNLPYLISQGVIDELVPVTGVLDEVQRFRDLGYRYRFELYPLADHLAYPILDGFSDQASHLTDAARVRDPAHVSYAWCPNLDRADFGIGATTAYWLRDMRARTVAPGTVATIDAESDARPHPAITAQRTTGVTIPGDPFPAVVEEQTWTAGTDGPHTQALRLRLTDVGALTVDTARAGIAPTATSTLRVTTDGPVRVTLRGLSPAAAPLNAVASVTRGPAAEGAMTLTFPAGDHTVTIAPTPVTVISARPVVGAGGATRPGRLPATGGPDPRVAFLVATAGVVAVRRVRRRTPR